MSIRIKIFKVGVTVLLGIALASLAVSAYYKVYYAGYAKAIDEVYDIMKHRVNPNDPDTLYQIKTDTVTFQLTNRGILINHNTK